MNTKVNSDNIILNNINQPSLRVNLNALIISSLNNKMNYISKYSTYNKFTMGVRCANFKEYCINRSIEGKMSNQDMLDYLKCVDSVIGGVQQHTVVTEKIKETEHSVTFFYYVITTSSNIVYYGGVNKFKPIFLCNYGGKSFYTISLLCIDIVPKDELKIIYGIKNKEEFRDNKELRETIVNKIIKMENSGEYDIKQLNIINELLERDINDMGFIGPFKNKKPEYKMKPLLDKIIAIAPWMDDPLENMFKSTILSNYLSIKSTLLDDLIGFYSDNPLAGIALEDYTRTRTGESDDPEDKDAISSIEKDIKDWIILYIEKRREEWVLLLSEETIEERNWILLKEIEFLLLNK